MSNEYEYFYNGAWQSLEYLHDHHGITLYPATPITVYEEDLTPLSGWEYINEDEPSESETWIVRDIRWYKRFPDEMPYYRKTGNYIDRYLIGQLLSLEEYFKWDSYLYPYEGHLYTDRFLHDHYGITRTPSVVYYAKDSVVKCWYNEDEDQYFDVDTATWYPEPPVYEPSPAEADNINKVGAIGLFAFKTDSQSGIEYGTLISASQLQPISMNFPNSGEFNYTKVDTIPITGTWRLLTTIAKSSRTSPCIVLAIKKSDDEIEPVGSLGTLGNGRRINYIETIEIDL